MRIHATVQHSLQKALHAMQPVHQPPDNAYKARPLQAGPCASDAFPCPPCQPPTPNPKPPSGRGFYPVGGQVREHVSRLGVGLLTPVLLPGFRASWAPLPRSFRPCWRGSHGGLLTGPGICSGPLVCCCRLGLALFLHSQVLSGDAEGWMVCDVHVAAFASWDGVGRTIPICPGGLWTVLSGYVCVLPT